MSKTKRVILASVSVAVLLAVGVTLFFVFFANGASDSPYLELGSDKVTDGHFIYFCVKGYDKAYEMSGQSGDALWETKLEGKDAERWIKDYAAAQGKRYLYINKLFDDLGLSMDEKAVSEIDAAVYDEWEYSGRLAIYGPMGMNKNEYRDIVACEKKFELLTGHYRDELGAGITDEMTRGYLFENYVSFAFVTVSYIDVNENSLRGEYDVLCDEVKAGKTVVSLAEELHSEANSRILTSVDDASGRADICVPVKDSNFPLPFMAELMDSPEGDPVFFDDTANMTYNIASRTDVLADSYFLDKHREEITGALISDALEQKLAEQAVAAKIRVNTGAVNRFNLKALYETV